MSDDYAHPVGQASKSMVNAAVDLQKQAEAAQATGDKAGANRLSDEAEQHLKIANDLDRADQAYGDRN